MTMFKKLLAVTLIFVGALGLVGCKPEDEGLTDLEKLAEALVEVNLASEASSDLTLPTTGLHDVVIAWTSSDTDVIADDGTLTIPTFTDGNQVVTITASLTLGDDTLTKTFDVTVLAATVKTDVEKLADAKATLLLTAADLVVSDIVLPATSGDAAVTWASGNTAIVTDAGVITRPAVGAGNAVVVLTATLTVGTETATKDFSLTIKEDDPDALFEDIADIYELTLGDIVEFEGIVSSLFSGGYILTDGTDAIVVFNLYSTTPLEPEVGDEVYVKGEFAQYSSHTLYQIAEIVDEEVLSSDNTVPLTAIVSTVKDVFDLDAENDMLVHGKLYTVTGIITEGLDGYDEEALFITDGDDELLLYGYLTDDSQAAIDANIGKEVTLTVFYYVLHGTKGPTVGFSGVLADITVNEMSDADALANDLESVGSGVPAVTILADLTLPTEGANGTLFTNWTSSDVAVIANDGTFVARALTTVTITFTADAAKGDLTDTATIEVVVPILSTIEEVLAMELGTYFEVTGVVYEELSGAGFFIHDAGNYLFVYEDSFLDDIEPGDTVTVLGKLATYRGLLQVSYVSHTATDTDEATVDAIVTSVAALEFDLVPRGTIATITGTIEATADGSYWNVYIDGPAAGRVYIYHYSNNTELTSFHGQVVTIDVVTYQDASVLFQGMAADVTPATFTDAQMLQDATDSIDLGNTAAVMADIELPDTVGTSLVTIVWTTTDDTVIDIDGTITQVSGSEGTATLTATVSLGTETDLVREFAIVVSDLDDLTPLSVSEVIAEEDGPEFLVTGIIVGSYYSYGDNEVLIQDTVTGVGIYVDFDVDAEIGDLVVVYGQLETYTSNENTRRQIDSGDLIRIDSSGNTIIVDAETDFTVIADEYAEMLVYTTTLTFANDPDDLVDVDNPVDQYGFAFFTGSATRLLTMNTYDFPYVEDVYVVGDTIDVTFTVMGINYDNTLIINVGMPVLDEAQNMLAAKGALEVDLVVVEDIILDDAFVDYNATITWVSTNPAITNAGVVTRPAIGEPDATGTLTATVTVGTTIEDVVFPVTVSAEVGAATQDLFFSEYAEADGGSCKYVEIYNPTDATVDLSNYEIINAYNGNAWDYTNVIQYGYILPLVGTLNAGETYVIYNADCVALDGESQDVLISDPLFPTSLTSYLESTSSAVGFNGDDTIGLFKNDVLIDVIGQIEVDPGSNWPVGDGDLLGGTTANVIMVRVPTVTMGETDWAVGAMQWIVSADDRDYSTVGVHTYTPAP